MGMALSVVVAMIMDILVDDTVHFLGKYQNARTKIHLASQAALLYAFTIVGQALWGTSAVLILGLPLLTLPHLRINYETGPLTSIICVLGIFA